jgi:predicted permease
MRSLNQLTMKIRLLFQRRKAAAQLDDELRFHLDRQIEENLVAGMSASEARYAALCTFGNPALLRDQTRATWSWNGFESLWRDLRYGIRTLRRTPGFTAIAILVMTLGIGANVALFTVIRGILLKPLPFKDPGRLVQINEADAHNPSHSIAVSGADFLDWQSQERSLEQMALLSWSGYNLSGSSGQLPEQIITQEASWNLFPMLGVEPALGRVFAASDDRADASATAVLTWGLWKRRFGGDPHILGQTILLDAKPYTVIGVLPSWFTYPDPTIQLWTPVFHEETWPGFKTAHGAHNFQVLARLKPDVTIAAAHAEMSAIQARIRKQFPTGPIFDATNVVPMLEGQVGQIKTALYVLFAATGCLLLIACLNIANLLVARAASRRREAAVRTALGGSRARLIREQVTESVLLSIAGGGLGLLLAALAVHWLVNVRTDLPRADAIHLDSATILFALAIMLVCGLIAGLIPALSLDDKQVLRTLQESSRSHAGSQSRVRLRRILLALEFSLTIVLLSSAGLLLKSYQRLRSVNLGCATENVLSMTLDLPEARYKTPAQKTAFFEQLLERVRALPGVDAAGLDTALPGTGSQRDDAFSIDENPPLPKGKFLDATVRSVDPGFFRTMQIPLLRGRNFDPSERLDNASVAVVTPAFVREFFPNTDPLGKHINDGNFDGPHSFQIIGVVADTHETVASNMQPTIYYPLYRGEIGFAALAIRTSRDAPGFAVPVQKIIAQMDRDLAVGDVLTMDQIVNKSTLSTSFNATLFVAFAVLSLLLAAVGLFGVLSYIVAQRTSEIGIRIALGAQRVQVLRLMLADGLRPALFGLILGLAASAGATRLIRPMLYDTQPFDPAVFASVAAALLLVAALACLAPAWRASRLDPMQALRTE